MPYTLMNPYVPVTDFSDDEANQTGGRAPVDTSGLDAELAALVTVTEALRTNLLLIQRSDGFLEDLVVQPESLSTAVRALLATDFTPKGDWVTATAYKLNDLVRESGITYISLEIHTSGVFATDLAANKWMVIVGDMTAAEIKAAYESNADTNAFDDTEQAKLAAIEALADVTDASNVNTAGAVMESDFVNNSIRAKNSSGAMGNVVFAASTIAARLASGNFKAITVAELETLLLDRATVFNKSGADVDQRMESSGNSEKFYLDAALNKAQISPGTVTAGNRANIPALLFLETTGVGTNADELEKDLQTYTMPANTLSADKEGIHVQFWGITSANATLKTLRFKFGSQSLFDSGADTANNKDFFFEFYLFRTSVDPDEGEFIRKFSFWGPGTEGIAFNGGLAQDWENDIIIKVTGQNSVTGAANDIVCEGMLIEYLG